MFCLVALTMFLFEGLAVCIIGGMLASGMHAGLTMATAVLALSAGTILVCAMYRDVQHA